MECSLKMTFLSLYFVYRGFLSCVSQRHHVQNHQPETKVVVHFVSQINGWMRIQYIQRET